MRSEIPRLLVKYGGKWETTNDHRLTNGCHCRKQAAQPI